jgi:hypothetical protein
MTVPQPASGCFDIVSRWLAAFGDDVVADFLAFAQSRHAAAFDRANMNEYISVATFRRDESKALRRVEKFNCSDSHI